MTATAELLRDLHLLHQRAKALRDRLASAPRTLASRQAALATRQADVEQARKVLQDAKVQLKKNEHALQAQQAKIDDTKAKLNQIKKNEEYKALQNQIAHDKAAISKTEDEILQSYELIETQAVALAKLEAEVKSFARDVVAIQTEIESQAASHKAQLQELETAIIEAEISIPEQERERYSRTVRQFGADALAACENGACLGCFTSVTTQMLNHLINGDQLMFCKSCGRLLYLDEQAETTSKRASRA
ncbi:MAG: zinc ribbon domain-containing protein [Isosphaeraceae bacterium]